METEHARTLSSAGWLRMLLLTALALALLVAAFNVVTDPFGAFGDPVLGWWSYDMTQNPKLAKMTYLARHHGEYDSYIVGSSGSSSYPVDALNDYLDARFYNVFFYGVDVKDYEDVCRFLLENYTVKHLVLNLYIGGASRYDTPNADLGSSPHWRVDGSGPLRFYARYLFADPAHGWQKLRYLAGDDSVLQKPHRVFEPETGAYDKSRRDAEPIGDLAEYLARPAYEGFADYPAGSLSLPYLAPMMESVARIRDLCAEHGAELLVLCQPSYGEAAAYYSYADWAAFRNALAAVTEYWDFSLSSVSFEPRYFYDLTHFRNDVGRMALARVFGDESVYVPADFGQFVPRGSEPGAPAAAPAAASGYTARVPILLYHHLTEDAAENDSTVTLASFREQMEALAAAGYAPVGFDDLRRYVEEGADLPEKPVVLTFDDGYRSNYLLAFPVLRELGFRATVFPIGVSVGRDVYKDTGEAMLPHFSLAEGEEMEASGLIRLESHGYDAHEVRGRDPEPIRRGALPREDETEREYAAFLHGDCARVRGLLGVDTGVFAYPYGLCSELTEVLLRAEGFYATVTTQPQPATLVRGLPQSLRQLGRLTVTDDIAGEALLAMLADEARQP